MAGRCRTRVRAAPLTFRKEITLTNRGVASAMTAARHLAHEQ
jgi:hypothetical protein